MTNRAGGHGETGAPDRLVTWLERRLELERGPASNELPRCRWCNKRLPCREHSDLPALDPHVNVQAGRFQRRESLGRAG